MINRSISSALAIVLGLGLPAMMTTVADAQDEKALSAQAGPAIAKICSNCHQPQPGSLRGNFESVAYRTQSIQIRMDDAVEILRFDKTTLKVVNVKAENPDEPLRSVKKGKEVRVEYTEKDGKKFATLVVAKPPIKVAPEKLLSTTDVEKLVAMGPDKGRYLLVDARPAPKFMEGAIPTAVNIPFPAFEKNIDKLPKDKNALIVYYCAGVT